MAGFFGLFGDKQDQGPQSKEAFFLSEDEAKTFGDIDYMRKEVVVRRTFAKKKGQTEEMESVKSISSSTAKEVGEANRPATSSFSTSFSAPAPQAAPTPSSTNVSAPTPAATPAPQAAPAPSSSVAESEAPAVAESAPAVAESAPAQSVVTRSPDTGMDMFRNMAKNMRR